MAVRGWQGAKTSGLPRIPAQRLAPTVGSLPVLEPRPTETAIGPAGLLPHVAPGGGRAVESRLVLAADVLLVVPAAVALGMWHVVVLAGIAGLVWKLRGLYDHRIALAVLDDLPALTAGMVVAVAVTLAAAPVAWPALDSLAIVLTAVLVLLTSTVGRCIAYGIIQRHRCRGVITHPTLLVGVGAAATSLRRRIEAHPECGLRVVGSIADHRMGSPTPVPLLGSSRDLARIMSQRKVTHVVIGYGGMSSAGLVDVLRTCDRNNVDIYVLPRLFELHSLREGDDHIWGLPLVRLRRPAQRVVTWRVKRGFDILVSSLIMLLSSPVFLAVAVAVRLELGPRIFFRQTRIGLQERPFELLKFRSMPETPPGAPSVWTVTPTELGPVSRFIRRYSLDELPQLLNVLRGDMSLVGPRPERPEFVRQFCAAVPPYVHRHRVPVGMTGLAAVNGLRGDTSIEDRAHFDNWYIDNWSLWLDIKIMIRTFGSVVRGTGG